MEMSRAAHKAGSCAPVLLCRELEPLVPCCQGSGGGCATRSTPGCQGGLDPAPRFAEPCRELGFVLGPAQGDVPGAAPRCSSVPSAGGEIF